MSRNDALGRGARAAAIGAVLVAALLSVPAAAQEPIERTDPVMLILDASGSMKADDGTGRPKIQAAKAALRQVIGLLPADLPVGLTVYGHRQDNTRPTAGCRDVEVVQPVAPLDRQGLTRKVDDIKASGYTPIALALERAAEAVPPEGATIILISDGVDTCAPPDPCATARRIGSHGEVDIRVEVVGFQVNAKAQNQLRCIARAGNGGYRDAANAEELAEALYQVRGNPINGGTGASDAPLLSSGRYHDILGLGDERWYATDLADGQRLVVHATLANRREGPHPELATFSGRLSRDDLLGSLECAGGALTGVGPSPLRVELRGSVINTVAGTGECTEAGRHYFVLAIDDPYVDVLDADPRFTALHYDVEIVVQIEGEPLPPPSPTPSPTPAVVEPAPQPPAPQRPPLSLQLLTGTGFGLLGLLAGVYAAKTFGA